MFWFFSGVPPVAFVSQTQPHIPPPMPQPGFFASALRGQALQYTQSGAASNSNTHPLTIPGPGFFSSPSTTAVSQSQSAIVTALGTKSGITNGSPQPVAVLGAGVSSQPFPYSSYKKIEFLCMVKHKIIFFFYSLGWE